MLIDGTPSKPFSMKGIKSETQSNETSREEARNKSKNAYAKPRATVDAEISEQIKSLGQAPPPGGNEPIKSL